MDSTSSFSRSKISNSQNTIKNITLSKFKEKLFNTHLMNKNLSSFPQIESKPKSNWIESNNNTKDSINELSLSNHIHSQNLNISKSNRERKFLKSTIFNSIFEKNLLENEINYDENKEKDIGPLIQSYNKNIINLNNTSDNSKTKTVKLSNLKRSEIKDLYHKYNIHTKVNKEEIDNINSSLGKSQTYRNTSIDVIDEYYKNPIKAKKKIKTNFQICASVNSIILNKQAKVYTDHFKFIVSEQKKKEKMPIVKISDSNNVKSSDQINYLPQNLSLEIKQNKTMMSQDNLNRLKFLKNGILFPGEKLKFQNSKPSSRKNSTMIFCDDKLYIFGGMSNQSLNDLWVCDIIKNYKWKRLYPSGEIPMARYGHSAVCYKSTIYFFGGMVKDILNLKEDIIIYDISKNEYNLSENCSNKLNLKWRRNHVSEIVGSNMLIYGGIGEDFVFLDDLWTLELARLKWNKLETKGENLPPLAYSCSCLVLANDKRNNPHMGLFKIPDSSIYGYKNLKHEGVLIYGGINNNEKVNEKAFLLKIGRKNLEWIQLQISGQPPKGKIGASMVFFESLNVVIHFGGTCEDQLFYNEYTLIDMEFLQWIKVKHSESIPQSRSQHCCSISSHQLFIFGGIDGDNFVGSELFFVELEVFNKNSKTFKSSIKRTKLLEVYTESEIMKMKRENQLEEYFDEITQMKKYRVINREECLLLNDTGKHKKYII